MTVPVEKWEWFGCAGHFCCANECLFHLCTRVGKYLISTVGEMVVSDAVDREKFRYREVGWDRRYETMVFKWKSLCHDPECNCRLPNIIPNELEMLPANLRRDAQKNHLKACRKYAEMG